MLRVALRKGPKPASPPPALGLESTTNTSFLWPTGQSQIHPLAQREKAAKTEFLQVNFEFNCQSS